MLQRNARVTKISRTWGSAKELDVLICEAPAGAKTLVEGDEIRAIALTELVGDVHEGDVLRIDCSALAKHLGTGGYATVLANFALPSDNLPEQGHIVKARYMPHQHIVLSVEEPDSPYHDAMATASGLDHTPVIVADLHSAVPAVVAGIRSIDEAARIAYVWDDTAALPVSFSMAAAKMRAAGEIVSIITSGQSFGGDLEAVSMPSALLAAKEVAKADYIVVAQGPGNLGTSTRWGFSGTATAQALHVAHALGGTPLPVLRASQADPRPEHLGVSHHSLSALIQLALIDLDIAVVTTDALDLTNAASAAYRNALTRLSKWHRLHEVDGHHALEALSNTSVTLRTMGRGIDEDALAFAAASAAGIYAATAANPTRAQ